MTSDEIPIPTVQEYRRAFAEAWAGITNEQKQMLRRHFDAPTLTLTATELAEAGGYGPNYRAANLQYGRLASMIAASVGFTGAPALLVLATFRRPEDEHWQMELRPQVVKALAEMKCFSETERGVGLGFPCHGCGAELRVAFDRVMALGAVGGHGDPGGYAYAACLSCGNEQLITRDGIRGGSEPVVTRSNLVWISGNYGSAAHCMTCAAASGTMSRPTQSVTHIEVYAREHAGSHHGLAHPMIASRHSINDGLTLHVSVVERDALIGADGRIVAVAPACELCALSARTAQ